MKRTEFIKLINKTQVLLDAMYNNIANEYGLTFNSLMLLYSFYENEEITQKFICDSFYLPKSTVHSMIKQFKSMGIIVFTDKKKGKEKVLALTSRGEAFSAKIMEEVQSRELKIVDFIGGDDCKKIAEVAERLNIFLENGGVEK